MIKGGVSYLETTLNSAHSMAGQHQVQSLHCFTSPHPTSSQIMIITPLPVQMGKPKQRDGHTEMRQAQHESRVI